MNFANRSNFALQIHFLKLIDNEIYNYKINKQVFYCYYTLISFKFYIGKILLVYERNILRNLKLL